MEKRNGGCHCGAVRYEADVDLSAPVIECNCSHCQIKGFLLAFLPVAAVTVTGEEHLTEYRFNTHKIEHVFCSRCGVQPFGRGTAPDGTATVALNVRTLDGIDLSALSRVPYDGRHA